ncbi:MAG TPA: DUF488 family protein [Acidimicrobiia bacterium]|nr:DUF488 family protein [Acidimicrobiia bacterium]
MRKVDAHFDQWRKDLSPTTELRQFYGHRPERFAEFTKRYLAEHVGATVNNLGRSPDI